MKEDRILPLSAVLKHEKTGLDSDKEGNTYTYVYIPQKVLFKEHFSVEVRLVKILGLLGLCNF